MVKYHFEKWDYNWNKGILTAQSLYDASSYAYVIQKNGELADRAYFADVKVGDFHPSDPDRYNGGGWVYLFEKTSATKMRRYTQRTKAHILKAVAKTTLIETIIADETEFPANGIQGDYWYVRGDKAFPSLKINGLNVGGAKIKLASGDLEVGNIYYKDLNNVIREIK